MSGWGREAIEQVDYARVSTREERQVFDRQIDALRAAGCHRIFDDCGSQSDPLRPYRKFPHRCCQRAVQKGESLYRCISALYGRPLATIPINSLECYGLTEPHRR